MDTQATVKEYRQHGSCEIDLPRLQSLLFGKWTFCCCDSVTFEGRVLSDAIRARLARVIPYPVWL